MIEYTLADALPHCVGHYEIVNRDHPSPPGIHVPECAEDAAQAMAKRLAGEDSSTAILFVPDAPREDP